MECDRCLFLQESSQARPMTGVTAAGFSSVMKGRCSSSVHVCRTLMPWEACRTSPGLIQGLYGPGNEAVRLLSLIPRPLLGPCLNYKVSVQWSIILCPDHASQSSGQGIRLREE